MSALDLLNFLIEKKLIVIRADRKEEFYFCGRRTSDNKIGKYFEKFGYGETKMKAVVDAYNKKMKGE